MNPAVEKYLEEKKTKQMESETAKENQYREKVLRAAGLYYEQKWIEVEKKDYYETVNIDENGKRHYFKTAMVPRPITDEEFAEIESTFSEEELERFREEEEGYESTSKKSWAAGFCTAMAWVLWIGGFIIALVTAYQTPASVSIAEVSGKAKAAAESEFSAATFISTLAIYAVAGCFALCASEHFRQMQRIVNLLREKTGNELSKKTSGNEG